jgi:hypothetical protein
MTWYQPSGTLTLNRRAMTRDRAARPSIVDCQCLTPLPSRGFVNTQSRVVAAE